MEANMHSIYHRQAVKLQFKRELSDEFFVKSDRHLVEIIINKLILNSCRFTEEGSITVGCNTSERVGQLVFFVEDTGGGIPENRVDNLFSWFDTPEDMNDEAELDLSICQRLAQKLGGALEYGTTYHSGGTRMLLILPVK
jgi:signal transduction histidine kinase